MIIITTPCQSTVVGWICKFKQANIVACDSQHITRDRMIRYVRYDTPYRGNFNKGAAIATRVTAFRPHAVNYHLVIMVHFHDNVNDTEVHTPVN